MYVALFNPLFDAPAVMLYLSEKSVANHHAGTTWFMVFQMNKTSIAELFFPSGQLFGYDMGVNVNLTMHSGKSNSILKRVLPIENRTYGNNTYGTGTTLSCSILIDACLY
jgi:hypothetical protein